MGFKVPGFVKKLMDSNRDEKIVECLQERSIDPEGIDAKIIESIIKGVAAEEVERFKVLFHELKIDTKGVDKDTIRYLVQELNNTKKALVSGKTRGKLKYIPGQMEVKFIERPNQIEEMLEAQEEIELRRYGVLDQLTFQDAEIERLKDVVKYLKNKLFEKAKKISKLEKACKQ